MKIKSYNVMAIACSLLAFASCTNNGGNENSDTHFASGEMPSLDKVIVKQNLAGIKGAHIVTLDDYNFEKMVEKYVSLPPEQAAGCSEVRKGDFVSRNLDWYQIDEPVYLMRVEENDKHLASLAVCALNKAYTHDTPIDSLSAEDYNLMMAYSADGMNSAGVYIGVNVVPFGEMSEKGEQGIVDYKAPEGSINANKPALQTGFVVRLVLDHAKSLEEAKAIIEGTNWKDNPVMNKGGFQLHWLVATEKGSFVCEFVDNKPVFIDAESTTSPDYGNIMTNFSNYLMKNGKMQHHGAGYERWNALSNYYEKAEGVEGAKEFARVVFFSKSYSVPYTDPDYFWTEWASNDISAETAITWKDEKNRTGEQWEQFLKDYERLTKSYDWRKLGYDQYGENFRGAWYTTHSSVWNLKDKSIVLDIEEQDLFKIVLNFDGTVKE